MLIFIKVKFSLANVTAVRFLSQARAALQHRAHSGPKEAVNFPRALSADGTYREPADSSQGGTSAAAEWRGMLLSLSFIPRHAPGSSEGWLLSTRLEQNLHRVPCVGRGFSSAIFVGMATALMWHQK